MLLARKKATGDIYAIKVVKKQNLIEKNQMYANVPIDQRPCLSVSLRRDFIANERNILAFTDNPFVVKLYYSFQSANNLYMVMEFLPGGDCFSLLRNLTVFPEVSPEVSSASLRSLMMTDSFSAGHGSILRGRAGPCVRLFT